MCCFVLLCATFATFAYLSPIPTAKSARLRLTCAAAAHARCQSSSVTWGGGCVEYDCRHPGLLAALCNFLQLFATFATFAYFLKNTHSQTHSPAANLCSSCTRPVPGQLCHVWGWPCGMQLPTPRASCSFVQLFATLCYFCYFCLLFTNTHSHKAPTYS